MRIYENCREMHSEVKRDLHEMGTIVHPETMQDKYVGNDPAYRTLELSPCDFTVLSGADRDELLRTLGLRLDWARAEFAERWLALTSDRHVNPGNAWQMRSEVWTEFLRNGHFAYTYNERLGFNRNLARIVAELKIHPDTRQAFLPIFSASDVVNMGGDVRIPCSLGYQFLRREGQLRLNYMMRSSDFITHFPYDVWLALELQHTVAEEIGVDPGRFTFFSSSLHIYAKDADPGVF